MKKKYFYFAVICSALVLFNCSKEKVSVTSGQEQSSYYAQEKLFNEEIVLKDESGKNTVYLRISSNSEDALENFLETTIHKLMISFNDVEKENYQNVSTLKSTNELQKIYNLNDEPIITIDVVMANIEPDVKSYYLDVEPVITKATNFIFDYANIYEYTTSNDFIGVSHKSINTSHYPFYVVAKYKNCGFLCGWKDANVWLVNGYYVNQMEIYPNINAWMTIADSYKVGMVIYRHAYETVNRWRIAYSRETFYKNTCSYIGSYEAGACYVGTAPSGTSAFMYPDNRGAFYYTPVNGNQCPLQGSWFDGANCYVADIPDHVEGQLWNNCWWIPPDRYFFD